MEEMQQSRPPMRVVLLGLDQGLFDADRSMDELSALCEAGGREAVACLVQKKDAPEPGTVLEKIVVDYGGYKPSYLFMEESPCKKQ